MKAEHTKKTSPLTSAILFLALGTLFGFLLSRAGATTYDFYAKLFLFQDFQLVWVIGVAALFGAFIQIIVKITLKNKRIRGVITGEELSFQGKPYKKTLIPGSVLFGLGWGLAGACPGTALAMLGEGKLGSIFTIVGFFIGTYLFGVQESRKS